MNGFNPPPLPPSIDLESKAVLRKLAEAHRHLAELKGAAASIPNESILISTLSLQEAKDSSEVENIVTTQDELFKAQLGGKVDPAAKEVSQYAEALRLAFVEVRKHKVIPTSLLLRVQEMLEPDKPGLRKVPGTSLKNAKTGQVIYTPPQDYERIKELMSDLEKFVNDDGRCGLDPLIKMALIHVQFESLHPFYDGNGRTGRILNVLYLVAKGLLDLPVLYLSRYITRNKDAYYRLLQEVRDSGAWESWVAYMLDAVAETSRQTLALVKAIKQLMQETKQRIRSEHARIYSQDLLNNIFKHVYTKIEFLQHDAGLKSRTTAAKYLDTLADAGFLAKHKVGRSNYYVNVRLMELLGKGGDETP
jgi:Fic family protein